MPGTTPPVSSVCVLGDACRRSSQTSGVVDDFTNQQVLDHDGARVGPVKTTPPSPTSAARYAPFQDLSHLAHLLGCQEHSHHTYHSAQDHGTPRKADFEQRSKVVDHPPVWLMKMELPTFSGFRDESTPEEFLTALQRYCRSQDIDEETRLRRILPCALVDDAFHWWSFRGGFATWGDFVRAFHAEYSAPDYHPRLRRELEMRTQHPREPLGRFVRVIAAFYDRLGEDVSEEEKVRRVRAQMHPEYRRLVQGRGFASLRELAVAAPLIQEEAFQMYSYRPPTAGQATVAKDLAYWDDDDVDNADAAAADWSLKPAAMLPNKNAPPSLHVLANPRHAILPRKPRKKKFFFPPTPPHHRSERVTTGHR